MNVGKSVALWSIRAYQRTISMDHGWPRRFFPDGYCRFYPTCSEYGYRCIERHGILKGGIMTLWRILRCNPFSKGGMDEAPE